jgi:uncharacterized protein YqjF (DUF2071 family)
MIKSAGEILTVRQHRPYPLPTGSWKYYQEWHDTLFLHWPVPVKMLAPLIPQGLQLDTCNGEAWISFVAFTVKNMHPRGIPPLALLSDFHELNARTYVVADDKPGIYFLSIEAQKFLVMLMARLFLGLPYLKSSMSVKKEEEVAFRSWNGLHQFYFNAHYIPEGLIDKTSSNAWLTERYCMYEEIHGHLFRIDIHHAPWQLHAVAKHEVIVQYSFNGRPFNAESCAATHYCPLQKALVWPRKRLDKW